MKNLEATGRGEDEFEFEGVLKTADFFGADFLPELRRVVESYAPWRTNYFLEWGSGLSTLLLVDIVARRGGHLVTIDSNHDYLAAVTQAIRDRSAVTALAADLIGPQRNQHDPELNYTTLPLSFDQDFDFILIDGRRRLECASSALLLTHPDSVIVLHDYRRARYQLVHSFFDTIEAGPHFLVMRPKPELSRVLEPSRVETRSIFGNARTLSPETIQYARVPEAKRNGQGKVVFGCVAENNPKFLSRTLRLLRSVRWFGGTLADADIIACVVDDVEPGYAEQFRRLGARVRVVPRFNPDNPFANKTQFFTLPELADYETAILLDCDTVLVQDPSPFLLHGTFQAKIADMPTVPSEVLASLCEHFDLPVPARNYRTTFGQTTTIWYCNSGVLVCPVARMAKLVSAWREYEMKLTSRPDLLGSHQLHRGQAALALAFIEHQMPFQELPVSMNLPLHTNHLEPPLELLNADPVILHYHNLVDSSGFLLPSPYPQVQKRIQSFNERLREHDASSRGPSVAHVEFIGEADNSGAAGVPVPSPICIAGMHRSGTSMVARLLHDCGVFLGPDDELNPPAFDNPEGFWENLQFVRLNEDIIAQLGGKWDAPPAFQARWEFSSELGFLRERAGELIEGFRRHKHWGWKDPRNSLTLPFWQQLIPDMKVVVCVRNPLEVAPSLFARGYSNGALPFELWLTYNRQLLSAVPPERRLVTHYQSYFQDPGAEVRRVLKWLDVQVSDEGIARACAHISATLRHYRMTTSELITAGGPNEVLDLYFSLCAEAGPVYQRVLEREPVLEIEQTGGSFTPKDYTYKLQLMQMGARLAGSEQRLRSLENDLHKHYEGITYLNTKLRSHDTDLASLRPVLRSLKALRSIRTRLWTMWRREDS